MNNNGVTNDQNINNTSEPVLTPINNTVTPTPVQTTPVVSQQQPVIEAVPQQQTQQPTIETTPQPTIVQQVAAQQPTPSMETQINSSPEQTIYQTPTVNNKTDNYQALQTDLNSSNLPQNNVEEYVPSPDDMNTEYVDEGDLASTPPKKKFNLIPILLLIILGLGGYTLITARNYKNQVEQLRYKCTPVTSYKEAKELDLESTLVKDLYKKVKTNIREDIAEPEWNNKMKLYLAYRQIPATEIYESNCNMFDPSKMEPYTCSDSSSFTPKAFKVSALTIEWKKLFGENTQLTLDNISLTNLCIGGYEYIPEREEYVQGQCEKQNATSFKVDKELIKAETYRNTIILTEKVKYHGNEKMSLPTYLKSGEYIYTFRLDINYNYVLVSKNFNDKYN